jgi:hypothetical protein
VQVRTANPVLLIGSWNYIFVTILAQCSVLNSDRLQIESGKDCEGIPVKVLDDDADQPGGKRAILCGSRPREGMTTLGSRKVWAPNIRNGPPYTNENRGSICLLLFVLP